MDELRKFHEQPLRCLVDPMDVLDQQSQRTVRANRLDGAAKRPVRLVADRFGVGIPQVRVRPRGAEQEGEDVDDVRVVDILVPNASATPTALSGPLPPARSPSTFCRRG